MIDKEHNWACFTTYKLIDGGAERFRLMEPFLNYYSKYWGIKRFVLFIGVVEGVKIDSITERIKGFSDSDGLHISVHAYKTPRNIRTGEWTSKKRVIFKHVDKKILEPEYNRVLNIDSDEFIRVPKQLEPNRETICTHMIEYVPNEIFDLSKDMRWCVQPFYYRVKYSIIKKSRKFSNLIGHAGCKVYYVKRKRVLNPWEHSGKKAPKGRACKDLCNEQYTEEEVVDILNKNNICYHMAVLDKNFYIKDKSVLFVESQTDQTHKQSIKELERIYNDYYSSPNKMVLVDNFLKTYWRNYNG